MRTEQSHLNNDDSDIKVREVLEPDEMKHKEELVNTNTITGSIHVPGQDVFEGTHSSDFYNFKLEKYDSMMMIQDEANA